MFHSILHQLQLVIYLFDFSYIITKVENEKNKINQSISWHTMILVKHRMKHRKWDKKFVFAYNQNLDYKSTSERKLQLPRL